MADAPFSRRLASSIRVCARLIRTDAIQDAVGASGLRTLYDEIPDHLTGDSDHLLQAQSLLASVVSINPILLSFRLDLRIEAYNRLSAAYHTIRGN